MRSRNGEPCGTGSNVMSEAIRRTVEAGEPSFDEWVQAAVSLEGSTRDGYRTMYDYIDEDYHRSYKGLQHESSAF